MKEYYCGENHSFSIFWQNFMASRTGKVGLFLVFFWVLVALLADVLSTYGPLESGDLRFERLQPFSAAHIMGTDDQARDIYSRLVYGARPVLTAAGLISLIVLPLGLLVGMVAGLWGGWGGSLLMRVTDIFLAFPRKMLALVLAVLCGGGILSAVIAISLSLWPAYARIARDQVIRLRSEEYVLAAWMQGVSRRHLLWRHILAVCLPPVMVRLSLDLAGVVIFLGGLGFLGAGVVPPYPEWGAMIAAGREYPLDFWWVSAVPGLAMLSLGLGFSLLGDGLAETIDKGT